MVTPIGLTQAEASQVHKLTDSALDGVSISQPEHQFGAVAREVAWAAYRWAMRRLDGVTPEPTADHFRGFDENHEAIQGKGPCGPSRYPDGGCACVDYLRDKEAVPDFEVAEGTPVEDVEP